MKVKFEIRWLVLASPLLALVASCGADELPLCTEVSWLDRSGAADLTGAPLFTASQIAPGDPIALAIPVNQHTQSVNARIRLADGPERSTGAIATLDAVTDGDETVRLPLEDNDLAPGVYIAHSIYVLGVDAPDSTSYWDPGSGMSYVLNVILFADGGPSCQSDIPIPTFEVVGE